MSENIDIHDYFAFNKMFSKIIDKYKLKKNPKNIESLICSKTTRGKYCINFTDFYPTNFFNKIDTSKLLEKCPYYPKSYIFYSLKNFKKTELENKVYFVKPKYGSNSSNISLFYNKNLVLGNWENIKFPLIFQEEVINMRIIDNHKFDLRVHVLYIKVENTIRAFFYKDIIQRITFSELKILSKESVFTNVKDKNKHTEEIIEPSENLIISLKDSNKYITEKMKESKNNHTLEFFLSGFDVIVDKDDKHWILEVNTKPDLFYGGVIKRSISHMLEEILLIILNYKSEKKIVTKYFIEI